MTLVGAQLLALLCVCTVMAVTIDIPQGTKLSAYNTAGYRQLPYYAFGVYGKDSFVARISGHTDRHPHFEFAVEATGGPNQYLQLFLYNADVVEGSIMPSTGRAATPCMDVGQVQGVATFANMTDYAFALNGGDEMIGAASQYRVHAINDGIYPQNTGLYIVTLNACRFHTKTNGERTLIVSDWTETTLRGTITLRNPFGYLPGQLYGFLPTFTVLLFLALGVMAVFTLFAARVGRKALLRYHWALMLLGSLSVVAYTMLLAYYTHLNENNVDQAPLFIMGKIVIIIRNTVGAAVLFLVCYGYGVATQRIAPVKIGLMLAAVVVRLVLGVTEFALFQASTASGSGIWGVASAQRPNLGWKVTRVFAIAVDAFYGAASAYCLYLTLQHLMHAGWKRRVALYRRTAAALVIGTCFGLLWVAVVYHIADGPLGSFGETKWKWMWAPDALNELVYMSTFSALLMIWLPRKGDLFFLNAEQVSIQSLAPVSRRDGETDDQNQSQSCDEVELASDHHQVAVSHDDRPTMTLGTTPRVSASASPVQGAIQLPIDNSKVTKFE